MKSSFLTIKKIVTIIIDFLLNKNKWIPNVFEAWEPSEIFLLQQSWYTTIYNTTLTITLLCINLCIKGILYRGPSWPTRRKVEVLPSLNSLFYIRGVNAGDFTLDLLNKTCSCLQFEQRQHPCVCATASPKDQKIKN